MTETQQLVVVVETAVVRDQARALLGHLQANRRQSERRHVESGSDDPMTSVTGHSAIDSAITTTRQMIARMDALLEDLQRTADALPEPALLAETGTAP